MSENRLVTSLLDDLYPRLDGEGKDLLQDLINATGNDPEALIALLQDLSGFDYKWNPVDTEDFILHPDYLGLKGQVYPKLVDDLVELFETGKSEAVLTGAIGWGKSTTAEIALLRMVYEVSCLRDPQKAYGLMEGHHIAFINASINLTQAAKVVFHGIKAAVNNSPYFKENFPYDPNVKRELRFPQDIWIAPVAASEGGTIGYNVFGGVLDEVNFWSVVESSAQNRGERFDQARHVYTLLSRRMKSRFNRQGKLPGVLLTVSSSKYPDDFTEQRFQEVQAAEDKNVLLRRYSTWSTKPKEHFSDENFLVYRGSTADRPFCTKDVNNPELEGLNTDLIHEVPVDFWPDFSVDIDGSIRDLLGFPTLSIKPFIPQKDKIQDAINLGIQKGRTHPYTVETTTLEDGAYFDHQMCKFSSKKLYFAHVDLALKKDRCGIAVGHIEGWKKTTRRNKNGELVTDTEPIIEIDLMLRVKAPDGGEIQVDLVRALLLELRSYGCNFKMITYDQYQSAGSIQAFNRMGIESERMSVDKPMDAYNSFKEAILEDRLVLYDYEPFVEEVVRLEFNEKKEKVDHPPKGSKDITDAVAGVVYLCILHKQRALVDPSYGVSFDVDSAADGWGWQNPARGMQPTVDKKGKLRPGQRKRTVDDVMFREFEEDDEYYDGVGPDRGPAIGFA